MNLIEHLKVAPQTVIFGSSRALKFPPAELKRLTGRRTFNAAVSSGRPIDEWCLQQLIRTRFPHADYRALIMLDVEQMLGNPDRMAIPDDLLWEPRLTRYLPAELRVFPPGYPPPRADDETYTPWGFAQLGHYDIKEAQGMTQARWMPSTIAYFGRKYGASTTGPAKASAVYLRKLVEELNSWGTTPVIALTPYNTRLLSYLKARGWQKMHDMTVRFVRRLHDEDGLRLVLLDFSSPLSIGGRDDEFYDGYHPRLSLARKEILAAVKDSGRALR